VAKRFQINSKVIRTDHGMDAILKAMEAINGHSVKVGFQANVSKTDGVDALDIAIWNEFGTRSKDGRQHIPPRPMVKNAFIKYQADLLKVMNHLAMKMIEGADPVTALRTLGEFYQARQIAHIRSGEFVKNATSTIKRKGSSVPLIDEGRHLVPGVRYVLLGPGDKK
jgi:hypothetical protein